MQVVGKAVVCKFENETKKKLKRHGTGQAWGQKILRDVNS
jgi:hypothetical protein